MSSSDLLTRGTPPPKSTTDDHHHYQSPPSSSTTPAMSPTNSTETRTTPESRIAAAIGRAIFNIRSKSLQEALSAATKDHPLIRTTSDANSSVNQDPSCIITPVTTPPKLPINNNPLRRTLSDSIATDYQQPQQQMIRKNKPIRRTISDASEYQDFKKTDSTAKLSPHSKRLKKLENMVTEIEQRCLEIMSEEDDIPDPDPNPTQVNKEESIGVERLKNGDVKFELDCSCGKRFEMIIKQNGYCFYKLA